MWIKRKEMQVGDQLSINILIFMSLWHFLKWRKTIPFDTLFLQQIDNWNSQYFFWKC